MKLKNTGILTEHIWSQRYRPQNIDTIILPDRIKSTIISSIKNKKSPNFIFFGEPGIGKTTMAQAIANDTNSNVLFLNGSGSARGIDVMRNDIPRFASTLNYDYDHKIVIIDEGDKLTNDAYDSLRGVIEAHSKNVSFIITCNYIDNIPEAVRGRFVEVEFNLSPEEFKESQIEVFKRVLSILDIEEYQWPEDEAEENSQKKIISEIVKNLYPNVRSILNEIQFAAQSPKGIDSSLLTTSDDTLFKDVIEFVKDKNFTNINKWVKENSGRVTPSQIIGFFYKNGENICSDVGNYAQLIIELDQYQDKLYRAKNKSITTTAFFVNVLKSVEFSK